MRKLGTTQHDEIFLHYEIVLRFKHFFDFTLRIHDASYFGIIDLTGRYSYIQNLCHNGKKIQT